MANGQVNYNQQQVINLMNERYHIDTVATYTCNDGYSLSGSESNTCQASGNWEHDLPTCESNKETKYLNFNKLCHLFIC